MICTLLNREIQLVGRSVLRFLDLYVSRAMGCFFGCFRMRDGRDQAVSHHSSNAEDLRQPNPLSSLFMSEEKGEFKCFGKETNSFGTSPHIDKSLRDEAKFLKACGAIPETPIEIRKGSGKFKTSPPSSPHSDKDLESGKYHSWLGSTSIQKFQSDKHPDQSVSPIRLFEKLGRESFSSEKTPISCISNAQNIGDISATSTEVSEHNSVSSNLNGQVNKQDVTPLAPRVLGSNRTVRFECDVDSSSSMGSSDSISRTSEKFETPGYRSVSKSIPYPTPLKLSDEMQTPGTVFPADMDSLGNGRTRVRSQFVYAVSDPDVSQLKTLKEEETYSNQMLSELHTSTEQQGLMTPISQHSLTKSSSEELKVEATLSSWLKPHVDDDDEFKKNHGAASSRIPTFGVTPGDRPIIGMVAAHWNMDDAPQISPKWWDGNGIPNSTNKYKEDQKVSWHATPFEERLEKALSEESHISQRKNISPMAFEAEESDTANSQVASKSVVSF